MSRTMRVAVVCILASAVVQAKLQTPYVTSTLGSSTCPSGFENIGDAETCEQASQQLPEEYRGVARWSHAQPGCISHLNEMSYWNNEEAGATNGDFSIICQSV